MTDNVVDASDRFGPGPRQAGRTPVLESLRLTKRVALEDRSMLARRLGEVAAQVAPDRPSSAAKAWFDRAWQGDRWAKRKRMICLPGETAPDPGSEGSYVASGSDWAALVEQAARALFPVDGSTAEVERTRIIRELMRGTSFLPASNTVPRSAESAQSLLASLARAICEKLERDSELCRLWDVLETTPIAIESYDLQRLDPEALSRLSPAIRSHFSERRYEGDDYSTGPLGKASKLAAEAAQFRYRTLDDRGYRFEVGTTGESQNWAFPIVRLGLLGHRRQSRIFRIPHDFVRDLPPDPDVDEDASEERLVDWLISKELMSGKGYEQLPDINFDPTRGYGWQTFEYELVQSVWLEIFRRADGSPGLWITAASDGFPHYYPVIRELDVLAIDAASRDTSLGFLGMMPAQDCRYEFVQWPTYRPEFMVDGNLPAGALSGLIDPTYEDLPDVEGWIDDFDNDEVQALLFRNPDDVRFCPSILVSTNVPPPCERGRLAAAIFGNLSLPLQDQLAQRLLNQAQNVSVAGLGFYDALMGHHRHLIESMMTK